MAEQLALFNGAAEAVAPPCTERTCDWPGCGSKFTEPHRHYKRCPEHRGMKLRKSALKAVVAPPERICNWPGGCEVKFKPNSWNHWRCAKHGHRRPPQQLQYAERTCAWPGCEVKFKPINKLYKMCSAHAGATAPRDRSTRQLPATRFCDHPGCGNEFAPSNRHHRFCTEHRNHRATAPMHERTCNWPGCETKFSGYGNQRRCAKHMGLRFHKEKAERTCNWPGCEVKFLPVNPMHRRCDEHRSQPIRSLHAERTCAFPGCEAKFRPYQSNHRNCPQHVNRKPPRHQYAERTCAFPGCEAKFRPDRPNGKRCANHVGIALPRAERTCMIAGCNVKFVPRGNTRRCPKHRSIQADDYVRVYVIEAEGTGDVKVGIAKDVPDRLFSLQGASAMPLVLLAEWPVETRSTAAALEKLAHYALRGARKSGEWFDSTAKQKAIDTLERLVSIIN